MSNSKYSQWFKIEPGTDYAICKVGKCGAKLSRMGQNSTSLRRHLESVHKEEWKQFEKKEKSVELKRKAEVEKMSANLKRFASSTAGSQSSSKPTAAAATPSVQQVYGNWSPDGPCTKKVHRALTQMIADCNLPLSLIEQAGLKGFQEEHGLKQHTLQKDMEVRWSSMYKMLEIFVANRAAIEDLLQDGAYPYISAGEWGTMQRLVNVLKPLAIATSSVQGHKAHIGTVLPVFFSLITLLRNGSGGNELEKTRTTIAQSLERRMDGWESNEYLLLATALDPRFKLDQFEADFGEGFVKSMLKDRANALASGLLEPATETETEALDDSDDEPDDPIMKLVAMAKAKEAEPIKKRRPSGVVDAQQKVSVEVETYLSSPTDANADPFAFWHRHRETLPILHGLAMRYLSAPATSAESERLFSTATAIFTHLRQSMTGTTFQKLLFLSRNMGLYGY